jgi:hypothetical protein
MAAGYPITSPSPVEARALRKIWRRDETTNIFFPCACLGLVTVDSLAPGSAVRGLSTVRSLPDDWQARLGRESVLAKAHLNVAGHMKNGLDNSARRNGEGM